MCLCKGSEKGVGTGGDRGTPADQALLLVCFSSLQVSLAEPFFCSLQERVELQS